MKKLIIILSIVVISMLLGCGLYYVKNMYSENLGDIEADPYIKGISDDEIVISGDIAYVDSQILVNLKKSSAKKKLEKWIKKDGGIIVGEIPISHTYQIEYPQGTTKEKLEEIVKDLEKKKDVELAILHYAHLGETDSIDYNNEQWRSTEGNAPKTPFSEVETAWNSLYPDGPNWWAEAIWLSGVGNLDAEFSEINVGIIDGMFDTSHRDLEDAFVNVHQNPEHIDRRYADALLSDDEEEKNRIGDYVHGTHVSGIIGARINNYGIAGVAPNTHLYGFSMHGNKEHTYYGIMEFQYAVVTLLNDDVHLINYSMSFGDRLYQAIIHKQKEEGLTVETSTLLEAFEKTRTCLKVFFRQCENYYDFLFFKSAGNSNNIYIVPASEEDENNDSIATCGGYREYNSETDQDLTPEKINNVSIKDSQFYFGNDENRGVPKSIVFVGAVERLDNQGKITPAYFSCIDADLWTPGSDILSDYPNQETGYLSGTSQATPIATGTAALVWGANPDLKADEVRNILIKANRPFKSVIEFAEVPLTVDSGVNTLNSYYAVNAALETLRNPSNGAAVSNSEQEYVALMGYLYEEAEGSPAIDLANVQDIMLTITDDKELYQKDVECLEDGGSFVFFIKPGTYRLTVDCSYYDPYEIEVIAKKGDVQYLALGLGREEVKKRMLSDYVDSLNTYYDDSYQYTLALQNTGGSVNMERSIEGFNSERKLGYALDDFDDDGEAELLVIATDDDFNIIFEMYEVDGNAVSLVAREITIADDRYGNVTLPQSSERGSDDCALISCFVEEDTHKIFLQVSYIISAFFDGHSTFITNLRYSDGSFCDMQGLCVVGSSCENGYPRDNLDLLKMGVPFPDIEEIFEGLSPLYECFDEGVYEICHARQKTIDTGYNEDGRLSSIQAITQFSPREELYKRSRKEKNISSLTIQEQHDLYTPIIEKYYQEMKAAEAKADDGSRTAFFGYADVDGNGVEELMLDYEGWYSTEVSIRYGSDDDECFAMYTIEDGEVLPVIESGYHSNQYDLGQKRFPFVHVYPGISLVERGMDGAVGSWNSSSEFYVYRNGVISDTPVFSVSDNDTRNDTRYEIDGLWVSKDEYDSFLDGLTEYTRGHKLEIYNEEDYHPVMHGE